MLKMTNQLFSSDKAISNHRCIWDQQIYNRRETVIFHTSFPIYGRLGRQIEITLDCLALFIENLVYWDTSCI